MTMLANDWQKILQIALFTVTTNVQVAVHLLASRDTMTIAFPISGVCPGRTKVSSFLRSRGMDTKSRFLSLRLFRINSASNHDNQASQPQSSQSYLSPPFPPPKDRDGSPNLFLYTSSSASTPDLSYTTMRSSSSDYPPFQSMPSPFSNQTSTSPLTPTLVSPATALRKGLTKLSSLGRRGTRTANIPSSPSLNVLPECNDEGISTPYNFQHNIHVDGSLQGMPPSWVSTLQAAGFTEEEINHLRIIGRERAATHFAAAAETVNSAGAAYLGSYTTPISSPSQFGELRTPMNSRPPGTYLHHHNYDNPLMSVSSSVRSSSPSNSRESSSPPPHVVQQPMLSPLYTQHFPNYASSSHSHQTYSHSQSDYAWTMRSHSPTETGSRAPTESVSALTHSHSQQSSNTSTYPDRHGAVTPPRNPHASHNTIFRVVNDDPTPTTPPPAYASPHSPYRTPNKGTEKTFRWDPVSLNAREEGPSGSQDPGMSPSPVVPPTATIRSSIYKAPIPLDSQPYRLIHITNPTSENETASSVPALEEPSGDETDRPLPLVASQAETNVNTSRHEEDVTTSEGKSLTTPSSRADSPSLLLARSPIHIGSNTPRAGSPVNPDSPESPPSNPATLAAPPRLSLHTEQDEDWSTMFRFSFSENIPSMNLGNNNIAPQGTPQTPIQTIISPRTTPQRASRRSSIIYGPRGHFVKEKVSTDSTSTPDLNILPEREENSATVVNGERDLAYNGTTEEHLPNDDWVDNYLDMKDGDHEDLEGDPLCRSEATTELQEEYGARKSPSIPGHELSNICHPLHLSGESPFHHSSSPTSTSQQVNIKKNNTEMPTLENADMHLAPTVSQSRFSDITVYSSSPRSTENLLPSPSQPNFSRSTTPISVPPLSPTTPVFSPTLSPTSALHRVSLLSRRSFDLPPPLPPPDDVLPLTPLEAAAMGLSHVPSTKTSSQRAWGTQAPPSPNTIIEQNDRGSESPGSTSSSSRRSLQRSLPSAGLGGPIVPPPKRELPPVPFQVIPGGKLTHVPISSISSVSSHNRSASGHSSVPNPSSTVRPPPLPLPPTGKVLPSLIMQQRRATAAANGDAHLARSVTIGGLSTTTNSTLVSHSSISIEASKADPVSSTQSLSVSHEDLITVPEVGKSPIAGSQFPNQASTSQSQMPYSLTSNTSPDEAMNVRESGMLQRGNAWSPRDDTPMEGAGQEENVRAQSPTTPLTPSIAVNGFTIPAFQDQISLASQVHAPSVELPLVLDPIKEYISTDINPSLVFTELQEVAQGRFGSVFAAQIHSEGDDNTVTVAVKKVPIPAKGTVKIGQLKRELTLMSNIRHEHILGSEGLFYEPSDSMLWIQMQLMERSLADILVLGEEGLEIGERTIARFTLDVLRALTYLNEQGISHRDLRSDNLLINNDGTLKLADFSNAVQVSKSNPIRLDIVGIHHWQAPEIRSGRYDALKIDVWSLGATVWECAELIPPFSDIEDLTALGARWPELSRADEYSKDFHDFLRLCSEPAPSRPPPDRLLRHPYVKTACPRVDVLSLLSLCRSIEEGIQNGH